MVEVEMKIAPRMEQAIGALGMENENKIHRVGSGGLRVDFTSGETQNPRGVIVMISVGCEEVLILR